MNALSLFTGIGGLDLAAEAAGIRTVAMCERDPFCRKVLRKHWPDVPIFEDVRVLSKGVLIDAGVSPIELIHGGFPCQPFSLAGRQRGKADDRYLWPEFSRIIAEIMPRWVICENVPGILSIAADDICQDLERKGYEVGVFDYEAAAVGAKHRRARVFFVAHSESGRCDPRHSERYGSHEKNRAGANNQTPGSGEPSAFIPNPGRRMRERGAIPGEIRGEPETRPLADVERSGCSSLPDAQSRGRRQGTENTEGRG
jgi:DNA (cytosine-5)-methyltransferase 1